MTRASSAERRKTRWIQGGTGDRRGGLHYTSPGDRPSRPGTPRPAPPRSAARAPQCREQGGATMATRSARPTTSGARSSRPSSTRSRARRAPSARSPASTGTTTRAGTYRCVCCGTPLFDADDQVRLRHRLAELLGAARGGHVRDGDRRQLVHAPHRGGLRRLRRAPRPRVRRRPGADGPALLHELRRAQVRAQGLSPRLAARCACCWPRTTR